MFPVGKQTPTSRVLSSAALYIYLSLLMYLSIYTCRYVFAHREREVRLLLADRGRPDTHIDVTMYISIDIYLSIYLHTYLSIYLILFIYLSIYTCRYVFAHREREVCLLLTDRGRPDTHIDVTMYISIDIYLSIYLYTYLLSIYLYYPSLSIDPSLSISISINIRTASERCASC